MAFSCWCFTDFVVKTRRNPGKNAGGDIDFAVFHVSHRKANHALLRALGETTDASKSGHILHFFRRSSGDENVIHSSTRELPIYSNLKTI